MFVRFNYKEVKSFAIRCPFLYRFPLLFVVPEKFESADTILGLNEWNPICHCRFNSFSSPKIVKTAITKFANNEGYLYLINNNKIVSRPNSSLIKWFSNLRHENWKINIQNIFATFLDILNPLNSKRTIRYFNYVLILFLSVELLFIVSCNHNRI